MNKIVTLRIISHHTKGYILINYFVRGEVIIDGDETGNIIEWQVSRHEFKSLNVGDRISVSVQWWGKYYSFSSADLPNQRMIVGRFRGWRGDIICVRSDDS